MSIEIPTHIETELKKNRSKNTYNTYLFMIKKIFKELFDCNVFEINKLNEEERVMDYLEDLSLTTKKLMTIAIVMILKSAKAPKKMIDFYGKLARKYRIADKIFRTNREATDDEKVWHITWTWIKQMKKEYKSFIDNVDKEHLTPIAKKRLYMGYMVFELLTTIPPQRGEALFNCYVDKDVPKSNMIDLKNKVWIIRESKTKRSYGERRIPLTDENIRVIKDWMEISNCKDKLLICNDKGNKMSTQSYTQFLNNTLFRTGSSRNVSTDDLRKAYVTHLIVHDGADNEQRKTIACLLGHSVKTMMSLYFKVSLEDNILLGGRSVYIE